MIDVIFVIHARGKISTGAAVIGELPEIGQSIQVKGIDRLVTGVMKFFVGTATKLPKPEIEVVPLSGNPNDE